MFTISNIENVIAEKIGKLKNMAKTHLPKDDTPSFEEQKECVIQDITIVYDTIDDNRMIDDNGNRMFKTNLFAEMSNLNQYNSYVDENGNRLAKDIFDKCNELIANETTEEEIDIREDTDKKDADKKDCFKTSHNEMSMALLEKFQEIKKMFRG